MPSRTVEPSGMPAERPNIEDRGDVRRWFHSLLREGWSFHPEESFAGMVDADGSPSADAETLARMDAAMERCYELVEDPCAVAVEVLEEWAAQRGAKVVEAS